MTVSIMEFQSTACNGEVNLVKSLAICPVVEIADDLYDGDKFLAYCDSDLWSDKLIA